MNRQLLIIIPAAASWSTDVNNPSGQMPRAGRVAEFVGHLGTYQVIPRIVCVDPKFAQPSPDDQQEISQYPSQVEIFPITIEEYFAQHPYDSRITTVFIQAFCMDLFPPSSFGCQYITNSQTNVLLFRSQQKFVDLFDVIQEGNYDPKENRFGRVLYNYQGLIPIETMSSVDLQILAYQVYVVLDQFQRGIFDDLPIYQAMITAHFPLETDYQVILKGFQALFSTRLPRAQSFCFKNGRRYPF